MSSLLNARLFEIQEDHRSVLGRYTVCVLRTLKAVYKNKPDVVFHQNPSIFLGLTLLCLRPFFRFKMVTDTHNAGLYPAEGKYPVLNFLGRIVTKRTDVLIVHNQLIAADVKLLGCEPFVLADPLPDVIGSNEGSIEPSRIVFVCRWSADEPYQVVMRAFSNLVVETPDLELFITGKPPHNLSESLLIPQIKLTGFLANEDYAQLLHSSALMIVLTDRNNSLNCGAYEAAAFEKPCILFDTKILKDFFGDAFIYAALDEESIANAMKLGLDEQQSRSAQMRSFKRSYGDAYLVYIAELEKIINM